MARELVFLEDNSFAAWGCDGCYWIVPGGTEFDSPPSEVKEAFNKHDCAQFPRPTLPVRGPAKADSGPS